MARDRILDFMQNHRFWLMDVVPSATYPFLVLGAPLLGFQSITVPEYNAEVDEVKQINSMYKKHVYSGGGVGTMTLTRGVRGYDDTFWNWMMRAIRGNDMTNRNLLLIHFTSISRNQGPFTSSFGDVGPDDFDFLPGDAWQDHPFLPGKAWMLYDCLPVRYKPASDFDALSGQVSISELEIQPSAFTELTLMSML